MNKAFEPQMQAPKPAHRPPSQLDLFDNLRCASIIIASEQRELKQGHPFTLAHADAILNHLEKSTAAMQALHCQLRGIPSPVYGDKKS